MTLSRGSCHCGNVAFEVEGTPSGATSCNCSICQRKGVLMWFMPREKLHLRTPEGNASAYTFNKHRIKHRFCAKCGAHPYLESIDSKGNPIVAVNVRCLEDVEVDKIPVSHFNGRSP